MKAFCEKFEQMGDVAYLGILWWQTTPETRNRPDNAPPTWITPFSKDERAAQEMLAFKNKLASMSAKGE
jgi:hypothetical protein